MTRMFRTPASRRRAVVLIITLWIVVVLMVLATSLAFDVQVNSKLALLQKQQIQATYLARSAVAAGMTHLQNDLLIEYAENPNQRYDAYSDVWAQPWRRRNEKPTELGPGTFTFEVTDEDSKININFASFNILKGMLEFYGYESPESDEVAAAIIDWRDPDDTLFLEPTLYENEFYSGFDGTRDERPNAQPALLPYQSRNEPFLCVEELLDVYGITPQDFYGFDPDSEEAKELKVRNEIALGRTVREAPPTRRRRNETLPMKDIITVYGNGRVNVNTASKEVLTILIYSAGNFSDLDGAASTAEAIIRQRGTSEPGSTPDADEVFKSMADLERVPGVSANLFQQQQQEGQQQRGGSVALGFDSTTFNIRGIGQVGSARRTIEVVVRRDLEVFNPDDPRVLAGADRKVSARSEAMRARFAERRARDGDATDNFVRLPSIRVQQWSE